MNQNPSMKDADKNLSHCVNPKPKEKTWEEKYWENQEKIKRSIFGED